MGLQTRRKKKRVRGSGVPSLVWRNNVAYWSKRHERLPEGRVVKSLEVKREREALAIQYAAALNTLCDRGDWTVVARWSRGEVHITDVARAVREGDYARLNRHNADGTRLGKAVEDFLQRTRATLSVQTLANYESQLGQFVKDMGEDLPMAEFTTPDAETYLHKERVVGTVNARTIVWSTNTQKRHRETLKSLWSFVIDREKDEADVSGANPTVTRNPWVKAKTPRVRATRQSFITPQQWKRLIVHPDVAGTPRDALVCAGIMGLRRGEMRHLRTDVDIVLDVEKPFIWIQPREGQYKWTPKTINGVRKLTIPEPLIAHFRNHREKFAGTEFFFVAEGKDCPLSISTFTRWIKQSFEAAGIKYGRDGDAVTAHSLRHSCATWMLSARVPLPTVAEWIGDTQEEVLNTYGHAIPTDRDEAIKALGERV